MSLFRLHVILPWFWLYYNDRYLYRCGSDGLYTNDEDLKATSMAWPTLFLKTLSRLRRLTLLQEEELLWYLEQDSEEMYCCSEQVCFCTATMNSYHHCRFEGNEYYWTELDVQWKAITTVEGRIRTFEALSIITWWKRLISLITISCFVAKHCDSKRGAHMDLQFGTSKLMVFLLRNSRSILRKWNWQTCVLLRWKEKDDFEPLITPDQKCELWLWRHKTMEYTSCWLSKALSWYLCSRLDSGSQARDDEQEDEEARSGQGSYEGCDYVFWTMSFGTRGLCLPSHLLLLVGAARFVRWLDILYYELFTPLGGAARQSDDF